MHALELSAYDGLSALNLVQKPVPAPRQGQVLVKLEAAPVNPSDLMFIRGRYGFTKPLPTVPGFEASGRVVAAGSGSYAGWLVGKRVACSVQKKGDGTWAEYILTGAAGCLPLLPSVTFDQGATLLVNPFTAWALLERAKRERHRAVVQTAAASALGRMIVRLSRRFGLPVISVVRRAEQTRHLTALGAETVLNSSDADFDVALARECSRLGATLALDAVAGEMPRRLLGAMPEGSKVVVYGALSEQPVNVSPQALIFERQSVEGFWLSDYLNELSLRALLVRALQVQRALGKELQVQVRARVPLGEAVAGIKSYQERMSEGKILLTP